MPRADVRCYCVRVGGQITGADIGAAAPLPVLVTGESGMCTLLHLETDQSGIIGLIRQLHALGMDILSVTSYCETFPAPDPPSPDTHHPLFQEEEE